MATGTQIRKRIKGALPYAIIGTLAILSGPAMTRVIYSAVKKEIRKREKEGATQALQETTFRSVLARLKKQGLIESPSRGIWQATKKAIGLYAAVSEKKIAYERFLLEHGKKRNTIIIFDVPEKKSSIRNYLRSELVALGYELLQKSVWIGGGPLPEEFINYLKEKDLFSAVHIFTIQKFGTIV